ncbi:MAG: 1-acyl-sn-glycerol-3-phosphate acyltransferase [Armatimonadetes bacterium]|nr:1-acyl-sn-glycerol-3-phosphate acyltransferase [Armatimonadota bacterium]
MREVPEPHPWFLRAVAFPVLRVVVWVVLAVFGAPIRVVSARRVPREGALLVLSNHISNVDPVAVQWSCPRVVHFMARKSLFDMAGIGPFMRWWRAFPVVQTSADTGALKTALALLAQGRCVALFPEGQLSPDGRLIELQPGVALLARKSGAPVVCVGLRGTDGVMPCPTQTPRWSGRPIVAAWGEPRVFGKDASVEEVLGWVRSELARLNGQDI